MMDTTSPSPSASRGGGVGVADLQIARIVDATEAEGPGRRFAVWFQGCPLRCPGCCNPEMWSFSRGTGNETERDKIGTWESLTARLTAARDHAGVKGITLLGGEPTAPEHTPGAARLARTAWDLGLSVMVFTGFVLEELWTRDDPALRDLLAHTDLLVDGPYQRELPESQRRWIGSANQRIHTLTTRHDPRDPCWQKPNTLEIRLQGREILVNGYPAPNAVGLWKRIPTRP